MLRRIVPVLLLGACSDYGLEKSGELPDDALTDTAPPEDTAPAEDTAPPADTGEDTAVDVVPCDQVPLESLQWWGSQPFASAADPTDSAGRAFWEAGFDLAGWSTVSVPDSGHTPPGNDRAYRATFTLDAVPERVLVELQSDDGLRLWVNGVEVGQWGGGWQEEGCVNDEAQCLYTTTVEPVAVDAWLTPGENVIAARVSNAVDQSYFQLHAFCEDG